MKSAYEIAMERLEKSSGPAPTLSDEERATITDIEKVHDAKIAETKLSFESKLADAQTMEELGTVKAELAEILSTLERKREEEKERVWQQKDR